MIQCRAKRTVAVALPVGAYSFTLRRNAYVCDLQNTYPNCTVAVSATAVAATVPATVAVSLSVPGTATCSYRLRHSFG